MKVYGSLIAVALATAAPATAQVTIGTAPGAPYTMETLGFQHTYLEQTFVAPIDSDKLDLTFWFDGSPLGDDWYFTILLLTRGGIDGEWLSETHLDQDDDGWVTKYFLGIDASAGEMFSFVFVSDATESYYEECFDSVAPECAEIAAYTRRTLVDAYAEGQITSRSAFEGDIVFEGTFHATPEPVTLTLLATGLAGLGATARRRQAARNPSRRDI